MQSWVSVEEDTSLCSGDEAQPTTHEHDMYTVNSGLEEASGSQNTCDTRSPKTEYCNSIGFILFCNVKS